MEKNKVEQRICLKFCLANGISVTEAIKMLQETYGESALSRTRAFDWYKSFKAGRTTIENLPHDRRPATSINPENIGKAQKIVLENCRVTERELAVELGISNGSAHSILHNVLGLGRVGARLVPKVLNVFHKEQRKVFAMEMLKMSDKNFHRVVTGDETWIDEFEVENDEPITGAAKRKKSQHSRSKVKVMLTVFFDHEGIVHSEYLPQGQTPNPEYYLEVLKRLLESLRLKRPELWLDKSWFLHYDNMLVHTTHFIRAYLLKNEVNVIPYVPFCPDMSPCDFFLFPKLKVPSRAQQFQTVEETEEHSQKKMNLITKLAYRKCFDDWKKRLQKCIDADGDYIEPDKIKTTDGDNIETEKLKSKG